MFEKAFFVREAEKKSTLAPIFVIPAGFEVQEFTRGETRLSLEAAKIKKFPGFLSDQ